MFKKYNGETALHMIMKKCSSSQGILKCLDNCLRREHRDDKDISNEETPDWGIDFSFLIRSHKLPEEKEHQIKNGRRLSINPKKILAVRKVYKENSLLRNIEQMEDDVSKSVRDSARQFILHPVTQIYLMKRWHEVKWLFYFGVLLRNAAYASLFSFYATMTFIHLCPITKGTNDAHWYSNKSMNLMDGLWINDLFNTTIRCIDTAKPNEFAYYEYVAFTSWIMLLIFTVLGFLGQLWDFCSRGMKTFRRITTRLNLAALVMAAISLWHDPNKYNLSLMKCQYHAAVWGVFVSWLIVCYNMERLPEIGLYLVMLRGIIKTALLVFFAFLGLLAAFVFTFGLVFPLNYSFQNDIPSGFVKVIF